MGFDTRGLYPTHDPYISKPDPCVRVRVLTGTGTGFPEKPQGSPCHSLVGLRGPSLAVVGYRGFSWACIVLRWPSLAAVGLHGPALAFVGLRWPSLAVVGCWVTKIK